MGNLVSSLFPSKPKYTGTDLPDLSGKVFLVTGGSSGLGKELARMLYNSNAKVWITSRSEARAAATIKDLRNQCPHSKGQLECFSLDLNDLTTIKKSAEEFLKREVRLDVLFNNAGIMRTPQGSKTAQGYEVQLGTNVVAPFLLTHYLRPLLASTARSAPKNSVRVVWLASSAAETAPKPPIDFSNMNYQRDEGPWTKYARSKAGNVILAAEFARRMINEGVLSLSIDPGYILTNLQQHMPMWEYIFIRLIAHTVQEGACTHLFAGLHPSITEKENGGYVLPFGRYAQGRKDLLDKGTGKKYWEWLEEQVKNYA